MEVIKETLWKRCLSTPTKPPAKNSNICLAETAYQHKGTRKKCKKTNQVAIIQWQRQCLMGKPHRKPWPKSKTSDISKQSPSSLHHTFLLGRARFTAQPLSALVSITSHPLSLKVRVQMSLWCLKKSSNKHENQAKQLSVSDLERPTPPQNVWRKTT